MQHVLVNPDLHTLYANMYARIANCDDYLSLCDVRSDIKRLDLDDHHGRPILNQLLSDCDDRLNLLTEFDLL